MNILVINTGSTSIKLDAIEVKDDILNPIHTVRYQASGHNSDVLLEQFLSEGKPMDAVVHRVVHGGGKLVESRIIDEQTENAIEALCEMAPLHNPVALLWIRTCKKLMNVPQVAVFDTAFFDAMPAAAKSYALPQELAKRYGIRRYGFHGIAHQAMWQRWSSLRPDLPDGGRLISIQLGGGCSITAVKNGLPLDTSMGFSPAEGLVMATRCGDIDPAAITYLIRNRNMSPDTVEQLINEQSGLLGISGKSEDIRDLINDEDKHARLALELYCYRLRKYLGAYQVILGGTDGLVFGGGVGENIPQIRARVLADMQWCGIKIDRDANRRACGHEAHISTSDSSVDVRVLPVDEASLLVNEARRVLKKEEKISP